MAATVKMIRLFVLILVLLHVAGVSLLWADDTDIYRPDSRPNVMILLDSSGSMDFGVYEHAIPYVDVYKYTCELSGTGSWLVYDNKNDGGGGALGTAATHYVNGDFKDPQKIYLVRAAVGVADTGGGDYYSGDTGDDYIVWDVNNAIDTGAALNSDGTVTDGTLLKFVANVSGETVLELDGTVFKKNKKEVKVHEWQSNPDGTRVDKGFAGMMQAPGHMFTGRFSDKNVVADNTFSDMTTKLADAEIDAYGQEYAYFFAVGNWLNMQMFKGLRSYNGSEWNWAWRQVEYPLSAAAITTVAFERASVNYPGNYPKNYDSQNDAEVQKNYLYSLVNKLAGKIRIHYDHLSLADGDKLVLSNDKGKTVFTITSSTSLTDGYTPWFDTDIIYWRFTTDNKNTVSTGWHIDNYNYQPKDEAYVMQSRKDVVVAAMDEIILHTRIGTELNWGLMTFDHTGGANGGTVKQALNPSEQDDQGRQNIFNHMDAVIPDGGTPLGEALQDAFGEFKPNLFKECIRNFVITLTDGFPSEDEDWTRISGVNFADPAWHDSVQFTADPVQYVTPVPNYYDDVAQYLYTHSWLDQSLIPASERATSPENITVHNIGFSIDNPMLAYASDPDGPLDNTLGNGIYMTAFSKTQIYSAFYSLGLLLSQYTAYSAPVASVNQANRLESGDDVYLSVFKPTETDYWAGNLKKYGIAYGVRATCGLEASFYLVDRNGNPAADCAGEILANSYSFWNQSADGGKVDSGGVGEVLKGRVSAASKVKLDAAAAQSVRTIKTTLDGSTLVTFAVDTLSNSDLGVNDDLTRQKIVNFIYGFTYDADLSTGAPTAARTWPLGAVIHSTPAVIDYLDTSHNLTRRLIAVGANDSMLHVFDDDTGEEVFAFVPPALLTKLTSYDPATASFNVYGVDAPPTLVRIPTASGEHRQLVFGLRRGGRGMYALDVTDSNPSNWTLAWTIDQNTTGMSELAETWAQAKYTKVQVGVSSGTPVYKKIAILPGGYDPLEDLYPSDLSKTFELSVDHKDGMGRAIYLLDAETFQPLDIKGGTEFDTAVDLPTSTGTEQFEYPGDAWVADAANAGKLMTNFKFCFPSRATVVNDGQGVLLAAYLSDIYGQVWKLTSNYDTTAGKAMLSLDLIFRTNPETDQKTALTLKGDFATWDLGGSDPRGTINFNVTNTDLIVNPRKVLTAPEVSYFGNDYYRGPVIILGTGDRTKPTYLQSKDGIYTFYDAHHYYTEVKSTTYLPSMAFTEKDLLNVSCGALEPDETTVAVTTKGRIRTWLQHESKGWFIKFADLDNNCPALVDVDSTGDGVINSADTPAIDHHAGEFVTDEITLLLGTLYVPTYQSAPPVSASDPCGAVGDGRLWAVDLDDGNAVFNFFVSNDGTDSNGNPIAKFQRHDRYKKVGDILPSRVTWLVRGNHIGGIMQPGPWSPPPTDPDLGMVPYYWTEIRE